MKAFVLIRLQDFTGTSGTGRVAEGILHEDGTASLRWLSQATLADGSQRKIDTVTHYTSWQDVVLLHGHGGRTVLEWVETGELVSDWDVLAREKKNAV